MMTQQSDLHHHTSNCPSTPPPPPPRDPTHTIFQAFDQGLVAVCVQINQLLALCCSKIAEAEAAVSVNEKKWLVMHMHVQLQLDKLRGPQTLGSL